MYEIIKKDSVAIIGVSPKNGASETFETDVIFCTARCSVVLQPRIVLKVSSYSQENSLPEHVKRIHFFK